VAEEQFPKRYRIYKAKKAGGGCASCWGLSVEKEAIFLEMAPQTGPMRQGENATFDWKGSLLRMKLGIADISELIAVLERRQKGVGFPNEDGSHRGLYHQNSKGNSTLHFDENKNGQGWYLKLAVKNEGDEKPISLAHAVSFSEGAVLLVLLRLAVERLYGW
jgi:hypothetical protein